MKALSPRLTGLITPFVRAGLLLLSSGLMACASPINHKATFQPQVSSPLISSVLIDAKADYPQAHASTLVELADGQLLAAWFAGIHERHPEVVIYMSRWQGQQWQQPEVVADGVQADGSRVPLWNPVLFTAPNNDIWLFYKAGPNPREWWGEVKRSKDQGRTWSAAERLPEGILGPIKNKPIITEMGSWLSPSSRETDDGWALVFESSFDQGKTWVASEEVPSPSGIDAIQPSVLTHRDGRLQAIARTRQGSLASSWSADRGRTWSPIHALTLPNPSSGTDAVTLSDGRQLLIYNPTAHQPETPGKGLRYPLALAISNDGLEWQNVMTVEAEPLVSGYSYPAIIQTADGLVHISYTYGRKRIKHVVVNPELF